MIYGITAEDEETLGSSTPFPLAVLADNSGGNNAAVGLLSQTAADNAMVTVSMWFLLTSLPTEALLFEFWGSYTNLGAARFLASSDIGVQLNNTTGSKFLQFSSSNGAVTTGAWHHLFMSANTNFGVGAKLANLYLDGANILNGANTVDSYTAFNIGLNGKDFGVPCSPNDTGFGVSMALSEVWIAYGQYLDPATNLTKFRSVSGHPVSVGSNGSTPTGTAPTYYFSGNMSTFPVNKGTGDAVTLTGTLTDYLSTP